MLQLISSSAPRSGLQSRLQLVIGAVAIAVGAAVIALTAASSALAVTPTSPPPVTILTSSPFVGHGGDFFISPFGDSSTYANGPEIVDGQGNVVWFKAVPAGQEASDFRVQTYDGQPVLTWWQGTGLGGLSNGTDYIYNEHFQQIAAVNAGNGLSADGHEFLITPWNTALILSYTTATANLTSIGGPADHARSLAGYYDGPVDAITAWLADARQFPDIIGVMYTTWQSQFKDLGSFLRN